MFFASGKYLLDILYGMEFSRRYEENIALNSRYEKSGQDLLWGLPKKSLQQVRKANKKEREENEK